MKASRKTLPPEVCMAGGGIVPDLGDVPIPGSSFDVGPTGSTTFKTAGQIPTPPMPLLPAAATAPIPLAPAPIAAAPAPVIPPHTPPPPMPTMNDILAQARGAKSALYGQYTPERRNELYMAMLERANSMPNAVGSALSSVGDAISRGYGRTNTNFLDKTLEGQKASTKEGLDAFDTAQKSELTALSAGMEMQKMDPHSDISKVMRAAYAPLLQKLGYGPRDMERMTGANVESVAKVAADLGGKEMENLYHQAMLVVQQQQAAAAAAAKRDEIKNDALKTIASHPVASLLPTAANATLKQQAGLGAGVASEAGPYGAEVKRGDKTYVWSPVTKKYHPKP